MLSEIVLVSYVALNSLAVKSRISNNPLPYKQLPVDKSVVEVIQPLIKDDFAIQDFFDSDFSRNRVYFSNGFGHKKKIGFRNRRSVVGNRSYYSHHGSSFFSSKNPKKFGVRRKIYSR